MFDSPMPQHVSIVCSELKGNNGDHCTAFFPLDVTELKKMLMSDNYFSINNNNTNQFNIV